MAKNKLDFTARVIDFGEKIQQSENDRGFGGLLKRIVKLEQASNSPAFVDPTYYTAKMSVFPRSQNWLTCNADPEAGKLSRSRKKAVIMVVGKSAITLINDTLRDQGVDDAQHAVAYEYKGVAHAGPLVNGLGETHPELSLQLESEEPLLSAAMREGSEDMKATLGVFSVSRRTLWVPQGVKVAFEHIATRSLAHSFPGVPLA